VVPAKTRQALNEYLAWIRQGDQVFGNWGGRRLGGPLALFCGASGVGKTIAASAIADALGWPLYVLDLGRIMSKYVGETEKNINAVLEAMHARPAILQIDEADGLLGKRGEVSEARDRWANLEVSHLLSRLERHHGPVILTTNLRSNMDKAFLRRFQAVIDFPKPDATARAELWRRLLPPGAPKTSELSYPLIGQAVELSGGAIHNAAIYAAMLAADEGEAIGHSHIARAIWRELAKDARPQRRADLGALAAHLPKEEEQ
jgi:SpoVK/Ycf46/Vps4 family AAA+-type ATPase